MEDLGAHDAPELLVAPVVEEHGEPLLDRERLRRFRVPLGAARATIVACCSVIATRVRSMLM